MATKSDSSSTGSESESSSDSDDSAEEERNNQLKLLEQEVSLHIPNRNPNLIFKLIYFFL